MIEKLDKTKMAPGVFFVCGDCDRCHENYDFYWNTLRDNGKDPRLHLVAINGGPLNLINAGYESDEWNTIIRAFIIEKQLRGSSLLKKLKRTILVGHWPCGQCEDWEMKIEDAVLRLAQATTFARRMLKQNGIEVVARVHFDKGAEMNTYHFWDQELHNQGVRETELVLT